MSSGSDHTVSLSDRRCALQALYQMDAGSAGAAHSREGAAGASSVKGSVVEDSLVGVLADDGDAEDARAIDRGMALAALAWEFRNEADAEIVTLAKDWPPYRQPLVDRNLLRLGWYEIRKTEEPPRKVINDAVELAKQFGTAESGKFVNAVLDRLWKGDASDAVVEG